MLILDKQKAVEHMLAIAAANPALSEDGLARLGRRVQQRIATYERRAATGASLEQRAGHRSGPLQPAEGVPLV